MSLTQTFLQPPTDEELEPGWSGVVDSFGRPPGEVLLKESKALPPEVPTEDEPFHDAFAITSARLKDGQPFFKRLREGNNPRFDKGVSTSGSSSENYPKSHVKIIDGEHKTLLSLGKISEAQGDDPHPEHLYEHRLMLASSDLSETQRAGLLDHIAGHAKMEKKKVKEVNEAKEKKAGYVKGLGVASKAKPATADEIIPQDDPQSLERKKTGGMISMESRIKKFHNAVRRAYGGGRRGL